MNLDSLKIDGTQYAKAELEKLAGEKLNSKATKEYERSLYVFIKEWLSPSDSIAVKTSGSTGAPKQMMVKKSQMIASAKMTCDYFKLSSETNMLLCLSTDFIAGKMMVVRAFVSGANLILTEPGNKPLVGLNKKVDFVAMIPLQVKESLANEKAKKIFESIQNVIIGGAPVAHSFEKVLAQCPNNVYATFAMTETLSHIALRKLTRKDRNDFFEVFPGIQISQDERNCLVINAPTLNNDTITTNDIVEIKDAAHFQWLGRYDNVINSGGVKLYPEKIEEKLSHVIKNNRFFIASLPDEKFGEKLVLVIEGKPDISILQLEVESALDKFEKPKEYLTTEKFIETPNGKVKRKETLHACINKH